MKFTIRLDASLDPNEPFVYREDLTIRIFATRVPSTILQSSVFGMGPRDYRIDVRDELYITNFMTSSVPEEYAVVVLRGSLVLATFTFRTS